MLFDVLLFAFFAVGIKVVLAVAVVYDGETVSLRPSPWLRTAYGLARLHRRWCPLCGERQLSRGPRGARVWVGTSAAAERSPARQVGARRT